MDPTANSSSSSAVPKLAEVDYSERLGEFRGTNSNICDVISDAVVSDAVAEPDVVTEQPKKVWPLLDAVNAIVNYGAAASAPPQDFKVVEMMITDDLETDKKSTEDVDIISSKLDDTVSSETSSPAENIFIVNNVVTAENSSSSDDVMAMQLGSGDFAVIEDDMASGDHHRE